MIELLQSFAMIHQRYMMKMKAQFFLWAGRGIHHHPELLLFSHFLLLPLLLLLLLLLVHPVLCDALWFLWKMLETPFSDGYKMQVCVSTRLVGRVVRLSFLIYDDRLKQFYGPQWRTSETCSSSSNKLAIKWSKRNGKNKVLFQTWSRTMMIQTLLPLVI